MSVKSTIQTAAMTDPGGAKEGLINVGYQVETELLVKNEPRTPADWQMTIARMRPGISRSVMTVISSLIIFFILYSSFYPVSLGPIILFTACRWRR